jgi:hypothetical protein
LQPFGQRRSRDQQPRFVAELIELCSDFVAIDGVHDHDGRGLFIDEVLRRDDRLSGASDELAALLWIDVDDGLC